MKSFYKTTLFATAWLLLPYGSKAEPTREAGKQWNAEAPSDPGEWGSEVTRRMQEGRQGSAAYELGTINARAISPEWIEIDPRKRYHYGAYLKTADAALPASAYFGLIMYDRDKNPIHIRHVRILPGTEAALSEDAVKGATSVRVAHAGSWEKQPSSAIAFGAREDFSDLPNFEVSDKVTGVEQEGDEYRVTLRSPLKQGYPAGTTVRLHVPWGQPLYWIANEWVPNEWKLYSGTIGGIALLGTPADKFWKGTHYVRIFVQLGNWDRIPKPGARLLFDDLFFEEVQ